MVNDNVIAGNYVRLEGNGCFSAGISCRRLNICRTAVYDLLILHRGASLCPNQIRNRIDPRCSLSAKSSSDVLSSY